MKNSKGFTVVELIASFALTMIISVFLFEVLIEVKDVFIETSLKTNILEKVGIISKNIRLNLPKGEISCNNSVKKCTYGGSNIVDLSSDTFVTVGSQKFDMPSNVTIENKTVTSMCMGDDCTLEVKFKLNHPNLSEPYNYKVIYYFSKI